MTRKVIFLDSATKELEDAVDFYNIQSEGLGFEFALEVKRTLERITQYPLAWHALSLNTKRCRTNRFPYGIIYYLKDSQIVIVAVMHMHRAPKVWE